MKAFVGITDRDWFELLSSLPQLDEVNFWQPSGKQQFRALAPGELFLFKLHSPDNFIVGGGDLGDLGSNLYSGGSGVESLFLTFRFAEYGC
ncbi:MAG: hypothetical protein WBJ50_06455 [Smithellaceae bacterium]|mgnify:CR=1 FL=1|jgi:putative restriction endonuclease